MPFGRFGGQPIRAIPDDYLRWLLTINLQPSLRGTIEGELESRGISTATPEPPPPEPTERHGQADQPQLSAEEKQAMITLNAVGRLFERNYFARQARRKGKNA